MSLMLSLSRYWKERSSVTCSPSSVRASRLDVVKVSPSTASPDANVPIRTVWSVFGKTMNECPSPMKWRPPVYNLFSLI